MSVGYKFKDGKFVERTPEEERRRTEFFAKAAEETSPKRMPKARQEPFIQISMKQLDKLMHHRTNSKDYVGIFFVLCFESFRHHGRAFILPSDKLAEIGGFSLRTQQRAITYLEKAGLILVERVNRKSPVIRLV
jgi:hypothetical protein